MMISAALCAARVNTPSLFFVLFCLGFALRMNVSAPPLDNCFHCVPRCCWGLLPPLPCGERRERGRVDDLDVVVKVCWVCKTADTKILFVSLLAHCGASGLTP
ncbi:hypothetical protein DQ04_12041010 [Trypanosoma grayi]|uniref:hypothetical protein n=1 Tax=Trypanosoma grayi TaxID=71804 RepID=UPI0004F4218B|nr:hypothetical protein DQ04_12041010 [Trypanosoma grayi]KEG06825.1 hypothetical protein DQ04_12041010 [Trypanosoma grayi]